MSKHPYLAEKRETAADRFAPARGEMSAGEAAAAADALDPDRFRRGGFVVVNVAPGRVRAAVYDDARDLLVEVSFGPGVSEVYGGQGRMAVTGLLVRKLFQDLAALALEVERQDQRGG